MFLFGYFSLCPFHKEEEGAMIEEMRDEAVVNAREFVRHISCCMSSHCLN